MYIVKEFYKSTPFNYSEEIDLYIRSIRRSNQILEYEDLHSLLLKRKNWNRTPVVNNVIEFGCGTGWLTNTISYYYQKNVKAIDFTTKALEVAKNAAKKLAINPDFIQEDIFNYEDSNLYDLVISMGVLHHTSNCKEAFKKISKFVKPGGRLYVGLYHFYSRRPMLKMLREYNHWHGEKSAYRLFRRMNSTMMNEDHSYSWFRDQVIHPNETQHTLLEVKDWLDELGMKIESTSINNYRNIRKVDEEQIDLLEREFEQYSYKKNISNS